MAFKSTIIALLLLTAPAAFGYSEDSLVSGEGKSSVHYDVTLAFGRCLGILAADAKAIAVANQATDSVTFQGLTLDFVERTSPNAAYFHSPVSAQGVDALAELKKWSDPAQLNSKYVPTQLPVVTDQVGARAGTNTAFGIYLHSLGDKFSHLACTDAGHIPHCGGAFGRCEDREEDVCK